VAKREAIIHSYNNTDEIFAMLLTTRTGDTPELVVHYSDRASAAESFNSHFLSTLFAHAYYGLLATFPQNFQDT